METKKKTANNHIQLTAKSGAPRSSSLCFLLLLM
jgi:hypothetical protein